MLVLRRSDWYCGGLVALCLSLTACTAYQTTPAPVTQPGRPDDAQAAIYTVRRGDTLYSIAFQHGENYRRVAAWNGIKPPYTIYPGQQLRLGRPGRGQTSRAVDGASVRNLDGKDVPRAPRVQAEPTPVPPDQVGEVDSHINWRWPTEGKVLRTFSELRAGKKGLDIGGQWGQPIYAAADGKVVYAGSGLIGYGELIIIKHNNTYLSAYAHNKTIYAKEGERVVRGERIADMGRVGTQPAMLHFQIRRNGEPVDPLLFLPRHHP